MPESTVSATVLSTAPAPSTLTIKVQTRHTKECPYRKDRYSKKCNCRKQLYIYENGKDRTESAKTRSWEKAEALARERMGEHDPVRIQARLLELERARLLAIEEEKKAEAEARRVTIDYALDEWISGLKTKSRSRTNQFKSMVGKIRSWAKEKELTYLDEIRPGMLYAWHGQWSEDADNPRDQLAPGTQNLYVSHLHRFFKWAVMVEYLERDPSVIVKRQKYDRIQTQPLHSDSQLREILAATCRMDDDRYMLRVTPLYGRDLRAMFLLQRWTGIRIIDAITLPHTALRFDPATGRTLLTLVTKKTGKQIKDRPLPVEVVEALNAIPRRQEHVRPGYYFWSEGMDIDNATIQWTTRIREKLNPYLSLTDEDGQPMTFRSHMLRDTFAVELLLKDVSIEEVSKLLTHDSIQMTEKYYAPWVKKRREKLHDTMVAAMERMGAAFTPPSAPALTGQRRLM
jgi:site-specific recombinase XerD